MNNRERVKAILHYEKYDRMPVVHFGFWDETLAKWAQQGHITQEEARGWGDGNRYEEMIAKKLGLDFNWFTMLMPTTGMTLLYPSFESKVMGTTPDGFKKVLNANGGIELHREGAGSIPAEVDHLLKDRKSWEKHFIPRLQFSEDRINWKAIEALKNEKDRENPVGLYCGSLMGEIRNWLGIEQLSYLYMDDEALYDEIINTVGDLWYKTLERTVTAGIDFDYGHFWEDICFKNGPLVIPSIFNQKVGPHYKRICDLMNKNGIDIVSLDCDGMIDALIPTWVNNGVNTMFPIEVGTWKADITPWREKFGKEIRGVGGMNKNVFDLDFNAVDVEVDRLKALMDLGGYIPCPDHRIPLNAKWENVQYYCEKMHNL